MTTTNATIDRSRLIDLIKERLVTREEEVTTSGGEHTKVYLDIPGVLRDSGALRLGVRVLRDHLLRQGVIQQATAIGGPTTGAIPLVTGVALYEWDDDLRWFIVRDKVKDHGLGRWFVGAEPGPGDQVILVDDVVSTGGSLADAYVRIKKTGAEVLAVVPLVDRSGRGGQEHLPWIEDGVSYLPVLTYSDLDLPPLGA